MSVVVMHAVHKKQNVIFYFFTDICRANVRDIQKYEANL